MVIVNDNDVLVTGSRGDVYLDLKSGYGQPADTKIFLRKNTGSVSKIADFNGQKEGFKLGKLEDFQGHTIEILTMIQDIEDSNVEILDISFEAKVYVDENNMVETHFEKKTKGKGGVFQSAYSVIII